MSDYNSRLTSNNAKLDKLVQDVNALPDAKATDIGYMDESGNIVLIDAEPGTYKATFWGRVAPLASYDSMTIEVTDTTTSSTCFIAANSIPVGTAKIQIQKNDVSVGFINVLRKEFAITESDKLYSFMAIADVHITRDTAAEDFKRALLYAHDAGMAFTCIAGDLTSNGTNEELAAYKAAVDTNSNGTPVYAITGDHETFRGSDLETVISQYTGYPLYYSFKQGNDLFIMLGIVGDKANSLFAPGELQWFYETLSNSRWTRCFVFEHIFPAHGCGNANGIYPWDNWVGPEADTFESLISHYKNIVFFHGHSHLRFHLQEDDPLANYDHKFGCHSVHVPSVSIPRDKPTGDKPYDTIYAASEGYVVDVYPNGIQLKGRDFVSGNFLPIATYWLDTTTKYVQPKTYSDPSGIIDTSGDGSTVVKAAWSKGSVNEDTGAEMPDAAGWAHTNKVKASSGANVITWPTDTKAKIDILYIEADKIIKKVQLCLGDAPTKGQFFLKPGLDFVVRVQDATSDAALEVGRNIKLAINQKYKSLPFKLLKGKLDYHTDGKLDTSYTGDEYAYTADAIAFSGKETIYIQTLSQIRYSYRKMYYTASDDTFVSSTDENVDKCNIAEYHVSDASSHMNHHMRLRVWKDASISIADLEKWIAIYYTE